MNGFTYNGVSSIDMGLRTESKNVFSAPQYEKRFQSIPGRDGDLILPNGRYQNVQTTYSVFLPAKTLLELQEKLTAVKAWLYTEPDRYHELRDTYDADYFRSAVISTQLDIEDQLNKIGVFTVSFSCLPFKYLDSGQETVTITNGGGGESITNPAAFSSRPLIRVNGNGNGVLNIINADGIVRMEFEGIESFLYVDSEQMNCYKGSVPMNDAVTAEKYPILSAGENHFVFSGGIDSVVVTPRWVTL